ncbi:hypothetical protein SprV_0200659200 [Sparganum proliferum]
MSTVCPDSLAVNLDNFNRELHANISVQYVKHRTLWRRRLQLGLPYRFCTHRQTSCNPTRCHFPKPPGQPPAYK